MKKNIFICLFLLSCASTNDLSHSRINSDYYLIKNIKKKKSLYVIYAQRNDSLFKIVSSKEVSPIMNCTKIQKGGQYNLQFKKILPPDSIMGIPYHTNRGVKTRWDKYIKKKYHYAVYESSNLEGLCLIEDNIPD